MKTREMVPEIYYSGSRDFSFIARLYEIGLNYMKTTSGMVGNNLTSDRVDSMLIELLCNTLGFTVKHKYITKDLVSVASAFSDLIKTKGSLYSIMEAVKILLTSQGLKNQYRIETDPENMEIKIIIPKETQDIILLEDLFDYILPAGVTVTINFSEIKNIESSILSVDQDYDIVVTKNDYTEVYNSGSVDVLDKLSDDSLYAKSSIYTGTIQYTETSSTADKHYKPKTNEGE